jgi:hypothetical protein
MFLENIELWGKCEGRDGRDGRPLYLMKVVWTQPDEIRYSRLFCLYF